MDDPIAQLHEKVDMASEQRLSIQRAATRLERMVPVGFITLLVGALVQFVLLGWYASKYDEKLIDHAARIVKLETDGPSNMRTLQSIAERLSRIEGQLEIMNSDRLNATRPFKPGRRE